MIIPTFSTNSSSNPQNEPKSLYTFLSLFEKSRNISEIIYDKEAYYEIAWATANKIVAVKEAMNLILSQQGLILNEQILSNDSKIALANSIKLDLQYAELNIEQISSKLCVPVKLLKYKFNLDY